MKFSNERFSEKCIPALAPLEQGTGLVCRRGDNGAHLSILPGVTGAGERYANAQLDDYGTLARSAFAWKPPVRLQLRARFAWQGAAPVGTAGFGFWNDPYGTRGRWPVLPSALWFFFGGAPSQMEFAHNVPGHGWKAASIHAHHPLGYGMLPFAPLGFLLLRNRALLDRVWPCVQHRLGIAETLLPAGLMSTWYDYAIEWYADQVIFRIDKEIIQQVKIRIPGPLGLVIWIDNQYLIATPQGHLAHGVVPIAAEQRLEISGLEMDRIEEANRTH